MTTLVTGIPLPLFRWTLLGRHSVRPIALLAAHCAAVAAHAASGVGPVQQISARGWHRRFTAGSHTLRHACVQRLVVSAKGVGLRHQSAPPQFGLEARSTLRMTVVPVIGALVIAAGVALVFMLAVRAPEGRPDHAGGIR